MGTGAMKAPMGQRPPSPGVSLPALLHGAPSQLAHLLILLHHTLAAGVKHAEGAQDGFLGVCPWEPGGAR